MFEISSALAGVIQPALQRCSQDRVLERLAQADASLWGEGLEAAVYDRLGWVDTIAEARALIPEIRMLREQIRARGLDRIVLCGMGGSSLAPEVICLDAGVELVVLDSSHPDMVREALDGLEHTFVVVSSKSGTTLETESHLHEFVRSFQAAGLNCADHLALVTDPGSAFDSFASELHLRVFHGNPRVGGRYSALTAFGLVPSGLAGADLDTLIDDAESMVRSIRAGDGDTPVEALGSAMATIAAESLGILLLDEAGQVGLGSWIEQLVAESLGKHGFGVLPIMNTKKSYVLSDGLYARLDNQNEHGASETLQIMNCGAPLGAQFVLWEYATAVAGFLMDLDPFDQPNVEASKLATRDVLADFEPATRPDFVDGTIRGWGTAAPDLVSAIAEITLNLDPQGYLALCCYLDRWRFAGLEAIANESTSSVTRPVSFGWGPRYLHSTGQLHKGGPQVGSFIHVSGKSIEDFNVAKQTYSWGELLESQVRGDVRVLRDLGRPVLRLDFQDPERDLPRLLEALRTAGVEDPVKG